MHHLTGSVTVIREVCKYQNECHLMERCNSDGGGVRAWRGVMVMREV